MKWGPSNQETQRLWSGGRGLFEVIMLPSHSGRWFGRGTGGRLMLVTKTKLVWCRKLATRKPKDFSFAPSHWLPLKIVKSSST